MGGRKEYDVRRYWPAIRLSAGLVSLAVSVFFIACALGLVPDRDAAVVAGRKALTESLAVQCSLSAQKEDLDSAQAALQAAVDRNPDVVSAGLRREDGHLLINVNHHDAQWEPIEPGSATETQMQVPIQRNLDPWGTLELRFAPLHSGGWLARDSIVAFIVFFSVSCFAAFGLFLRPLFQGAPASGGAVPQRVKSAMNTLAEGVLILDKNERIAMANQAFSQLVGLSPAELQGKKVSELPFFKDDEAGDLELPWKKAVQEGETQTGVVMGLKTEQALPKRVSINSTPILGEDGVQRGAMATFDNLTILERKHAQLRKVLDRLRVSRKVVRRQNHELKALATRDPLTGCFNRRTLFTEFEKMWESSKRFKKPLSCVMVDVDHFKSINDRFGHQVGDEVLKAVAQTLRDTARKSDVVCRYGGEEFCILLPGIDIAEAEQAAERYRAALAAKPLGDVPVTASLGVSSLSLGPKHPQDMMEQSDKALYAAKRSGRNKVMRFDLAPKDLMESNKVDQRKPHAEVPKTPKSSDHLAIPFQAVSGLLAALSYRHAETAEHCRRVADLCVLAAGGLMSQKEAYIAEMAALLHDIGKLGVPDNVLLKPGPLSTEEWKTLRTHEQIGVEIIRAAFTSDELADLVRLQHCWYGGTPTDAALPKGQKLPLAARLLAVANAYDSMTTDHIYRKAMSSEQAFEELRRCSGTQFDPVVTEHFIKAIVDRGPDVSRPKFEPLAISKQTALKIGVQIEKLAMAVDAEDLSSLTSLASQLKAMAAESKIGTIADAAAKLEQSAASKSNQMDLMELTIDLLEMCRRTQRSLLPATPKPKRSRPKTSDSVELGASAGTPANGPLSGAKIMNPTPVSLSRPAQFRTPKPGS